MAAHIHREIEREREREREREKESNSKKKSLWLVNNEGAQFPTKNLIKIIQINETKQNE